MVRLRSAVNYLQNRAQAISITDCKTPASPSTRQLQAVPDTVLVQGAGTPNSAMERLHQLSSLIVPADMQLAGAFCVKLPGYTLQRGKSGSMLLISGLETSKRK